MDSVVGPGGTYRVFGGDLPATAEALERILAQAPGPVAAGELVPLHRAHGRVLAATLTAPADVPPFRRSTVDGYAVRNGDVAAAAAERPAELVWRGEVAMGEEPRHALGAGEAVTVATGAMLPAGADAVVMVEDTAAEGRRVSVRRAVREGENVLPRGADVRAGDTVVAGGTLLGPAQVGALAASGHAEVPVHPRPLVAIVAGGDELVPPHAQPGPGRIRDSNSYALAAAVRRDGAAPWISGRAGDRADVLASALAGCLERADLVLISGGSSVGTRDVTQDALARLGARVLVHGVAVKPGKPTLAALLGEKMLFGLPGNPVSALVIHDLFVRPVLARRMGMEHAPGWRRERARLAGTVRRSRTREELVRVRLRSDGGESVAEPVPGGSGMLQSLVNADAYLFVPFAREGFDDGEQVEVWRIPGSGGSAWTAMT